jgi:HAMP domain-containing protein
MYFVYSTVGFVEIFVLLASAIGAIFLIARAIGRALLVRKDETQTVTAKDMHLNKRADRPFG